MKAPTVKAPGMNPEPHSFFLLSGAYSSFVLTVKPRGEDNLLAPMEDGDLWGSDCVQLSEAAVFLSLGSDAVNQALWVYLDAEGKTDPPDRTSSATFLSQGEQVYLESLIDMTFGEHCDQFFLPEGEYEVKFLSWHPTDGGDNFDAEPARFLENSHHELHFTSTASGSTYSRTQQRPEKPLADHSDF